MYAGLVPAVKREDEEMKQMVVAAALCMAAMMSFGQDQAPKGGEAGGRERFAEMRQVEMQYREAVEKLRQSDPEVKAASDAVKAAMEKEKALVDARLKANPETAALLAKREEMLAKRKDRPRPDGEKPREGRKPKEGAAE